MYQCNETHTCDYFELSPIRKKAQESIYHSSSFIRVTILLQL